MKKFFKKTEGFTLVELIVVIAILGILAGVGTVGYSGYIKKAHMSADQQLVGNVKSALELAAVSNVGHTFGGGGIVLSAGDADFTDGIEAADEEFLDKAMKAYFGESWKTLCKLQYDGWEGTGVSDVESYKGSSYYGKEEELLGKVGDLAGAMTSFLGTPRNIPDAITEYMESYGADVTDATSVANSTAMVLSQGLQDSTVKTAVKNALDGAGGTFADKYQYYVGQGAANPVESAAADVSMKIQKAYEAAYKDTETGNVDQAMVALATTATMYAYMESYAQYASANGYEVPQTLLTQLHADFNNPYKEDGVTPKESGDHLTTMANAMGAIFATGITPEGSAVATVYLDGPTAVGKKDTLAIVDMMSVIKANEDALMKDVSNPNYFTDGKLSGMLQATLWGADTGEVVVALGASGVAGCNPMGILG